MEVNSARLRMATLPAPATVYFTDGIWVPLVDVDSVFILPGIPRLFKQMIESHKVRPLIFLKCQGMPGLRSAAASLRHAGRRQHHMTGLH